MIEVKLINSNEVAVIDIEDYETISKFEWELHTGPKGNKYARTRYKGNNAQLWMHHFILPKGIHEIDHIDGNGLNNCRNNLRYATHSQNLANAKLSILNKTGYKGVSFCKQTGLWRASIKVRGRAKNLGRYFTKEEAALAYNEAAELYFGEFGYRNKIKEVA